MRKGNIIAAIGIVVIIAFLLSISDKNKLYEKKVNYKSPDEVISVLNSIPLSVYDKSSNTFIQNDEFKECLSKRKRVTDSLVGFRDLKLEIDTERNTEKGKEEIISYYLSKLDNLYSYEKPNKIEAVALKGIGRTQYYSGEDDFITLNLDVSIVFIDEGEGWVIDYFTYSEIL